jgi:hypothetical protein
MLPGDPERGCGNDDLGFLLALLLKVITGVVVGSVALYVAAKLISGVVVRTRHSGWFLLDG